MTLQEPRTPKLPLRREKRHFPLYLPVFPPMMGVEPRFGDTQRQFELWKGHRAAIGKPYEIRFGQGGAEELRALLAAYEADSSEANLDAVLDFIETETGQTIEELTQETWDLVETDGVSRSVIVDVLGVPVAFTIDAEETTVGAYCPLNHTMEFTLPQLSFDLPTLDYQDPSASPTSGIFAIVSQMPDAAVEIQQPEYVQIPVIEEPLPPDPDDYATNPLYTAIDARDQVSSSLIGTASGLPGDPQSYFTAAKIKGSWTANIYHVLTNFPVPNFQWYGVLPPLFAVASSQRLPEASELGFPWRDTAWPPMVGAWDDYPNSTILAIQDGFPTTDYPTYPVSGIGGNNSESAGYQCWFHAQTTGVGTSYVFAGNATTATSDATAWANFIDMIDDYNANKTIYDPVVSVDEDAMTLTAIYETDENAMYVPVAGCNISVASDPVDTLYNFLTAAWGGYRWEGRSNGPWANWASNDSGTNFFIMGNGPLHRYMAREVHDFAWHQDDTSVGIMHTEMDRIAPTTVARTGLVASVSAADGEPPETTPSPPPVNPVGGGCRSSIDGPSSCNFTVPPVDDEFPLPGDTVGDMPVYDTNLPDFPSLNCVVPDFGNMDTCGGGSGGIGGGGGPGMNGTLPGGRDRTGRTGNRHGGIKTGGPTYGPPRTRTFDEKKCYPEGFSIMGMITDLLLLAGVQAIDIVFQIGPEWDKTLNRDKCFRKGGRIFDAATWGARMLMCDIIDEGPPTHNVYIGPPWHRPGQVTWHFMDHFPNTEGYLPLFNIAPAYSSEDLVDFVEVFGAHLSSPVVSFIDSPFAPGDGSSKLIEVGPDYSVADAEDWAAYHAARIRRKAVSVQVTVPHDGDLEDDENYFMRDGMVTHLPTRGFEETWVIFGKESQLARDGYFHILTGVLPATVEELERFPTVIEE